MSDKRNKWVPLEANPEVFNDWSRCIGLPDAPLSFQDLFSLDEDFLSFVPQPVKAVLLLFPSRGKLASARKQEEADGKGVWKGEDIWWCKQTIGNACGSMGLLHALLNLPQSGAYGLLADSPLAKFKADTATLTGLQRAQKLEDADFFETAHQSVVSRGQADVPDDLDVDTHFLAFIEAKNQDGENHIVEMDGDRQAPFDRGPCTDFLRDTARVVKEMYFDRADGDIEFNLIVLAAQPED